MATRDPKAVYDGFQAIRRGVNSGIAPNSLGRDQVAWAINTTFRGQFPTARPGISEIALRYVDANGAVDATLESNARTKLFQGAQVYYPRDLSHPFIVASIGGRLFKYNVGSDLSVQDISIAGDLNPDNRIMTWMAQAEEFLVIQDGQSAPLIFDGAGLRRAMPGTEIAAGTVMEYALGRLWVASPSRHEFMAGNIVYGEGGTAAYDSRDAVLKISENQFLSGGGAFSVPPSGGVITAMRSPANMDTSLGQGPLQVFTERAVFSVNAPFDRDSWFDLTYPIQAVSLINYGAQAQHSTVLVNGDIWYRAEDGIRSFVIARRDHGTWVNTPLSSELERILAYDDRHWLSHSSAALFDNRLLMTASPYWNAGHGVAHRGLAVMDFHPVSGVSERGLPSWEGVWTGLQVLQILKGTFENQERCFLFALNTDDEIELWELSRQDRFDNGNGRIVWSLETPSYSFGSGGWSLVKLTTGDLWIDRVAGTVDFNLDFRPDQHPLWRDWHAWSECANYQDCTTPQCGTVQEYLEQYRARMRLPQPSDACDSVTSKPYREGFEFQARLTVTGYARVKKLRLVAHEVQEEPNGECRGDAACQSLTGCLVDDFAYTIT